MKRVVLLILMVVLGCCGSVVAGDLDFSKAVVIGSGPKTVVEFTDPDCPFCRKASTYFDGRKDVTRYVYFSPLPMHQMAKEKAKYLLSQSDKAAAYHEVMGGKVDGQPSYKFSSAGARLLEEQMDIAKGFKVNATPTFIINGRIIEGFDLKKIEQMLGPK